MKITRLKLKNLRNEEWFNFFTEFKTLVTQADPDVLNIEALFSVFLTLYAQADDALEILRKSSFTSDIVNLDGHRDSTFSGLAENIHSGLRHYDVAHHEAATRIIPVLDLYGNLAQKSYNEETAGIANLLQELRNNYAPQVQTLGLGGWLDALEQDNNAFEAAILARNAEIAARPDLKMFEVRRTTDRCYLDMVERLEALALINGDATYADFVGKLNVNIGRYKNTLSRRGEHKTEEKITEDE